MFCPKCATELTRRDDEWLCVPGKMSLSRDVARRLTERYASHEPSAMRGSTPFATNPWYCPGCGVALDADLLCPRCHLSLKDLQYPLIEFHPHQSQDGEWR